MLEASQTNNDHEALITTTKAVVIGASTGGPEALLEIFKSLPKDLPASIFIAQHMLKDFLPDFASRLNEDIDLTVELSKQNKMIDDNTVYVADGNGDTKVIEDSLGRRRFLEVPASTLLIPSVDILMASVATAYGNQSLGIILTGMGRDGLEGMRAIKAVGGTTIVQDEATSAVYGMAQAVKNEHLADITLPLSSIANAIIEWSKS